jgi:hypothetical protein
VVAVEPAAKTAPPTPEPPKSDAGAPGTETKPADPAASVDPAKGGTSIFEPGAFKHDDHGQEAAHGAAEPGKEAPAEEGAAKADPKTDAPDPVTDPGATVRFFIGKGLGWPALKDAYGKQQAQMTALFLFRKEIVDSILNKLVAEQKGEIGYESNGSANLTSDYDLSLFDKGKGIGNPAEAIKLFNERFRGVWGCESGTAFDTNVYDKGDAMPIKGVERNKDVVAAEKAIGAENATVQDVAALVKVRRYMPNDGDKPSEGSSAWDTYCEKSQEAVSPDEQHAGRQALKENQKEANAQYVKSEEDLEARIQLLKQQNQTQSEADLKLQASNQLYGEELAKVQAARKTQAEKLADLEAARKLQDGAQKELAIKAAEDGLKAAALAIKTAMSVSLNFANEAYNSEGALVDVVGNQQGAVRGALGLEKGAPGSTQELTKQDEVSSFNEQYGDALKDLQHYGGADPVTMGVQTSKYIDRFISVGMAICDKKPADPKAVQAKAELLGMQDSNLQLKAMRGAPELPRDKAPKLMKDVAGDSAEAYADKLTRLNMMINAIARG